VLGLEGRSSAPLQIRPHFCLYDVQEEIDKSLFRNTLSYVAFEDGENKDV
jgi:hypothetical protein